MSHAHACDIGVFLFRCFIGYTTSIKLWYLDLFTVYKNVNIT